MTTNNQMTIKGFFHRDDVKSKFNELMGNRSAQFITSVLSVVNNNNYLKNASPESVFSSALMAATLDLPVNPNLGFAYIIPYGQQAQFQVGYKGLIQLALRSGQFKTISVTPVYEGQIKQQNPLTGFEFDWSNKQSDNVVGYAAYFSLINGFEKTMYMTTEEINAHGKRFSKTYGNGVWKSDYNAMAQKTVLKLLLSRFAPLSIEMQKAVIADQSIIRDVENMDVEYIDAGQDVSEAKEKAAQVSIDRINKLKASTND
jgi:recombination protein RecT